MASNIDLIKEYNKQEEKKANKKAKTTKKMKETHLINRFAKHVETLLIDSDPNKSEVIKFYRKVLNAVTKECGSDIQAFDMGEAVKVWNENGCK